MIRIKLLLFALFFISMVLLPYLSHTDVVQLKVLFCFFGPRIWKKGCKDVTFLQELDVLQSVKTRSELVKSAQSNMGWDICGFGKIRFPYYQSQYLNLMTELTSKTFDLWKGLGPVGEQGESARDHLMYTM